tara:strand:+ start:346 stop:540 length:195 start_codon:yes stop_codon:yes gene_type:complete
MIELVFTGSDLSNLHEVVNAKTIKKGKKLDSLHANLKSFAVRTTFFGGTVKRHFPSILGLAKLV